MSSGERTPYEVLAVRLGLATRALVGQADCHHQILRAAAAMVQGRSQVAHFLSDLILAPCEKAGGDPMGDDVKDRRAEQLKTCNAHYPGNWREWCWPCRTREIVDKATR